MSDKDKKVAQGIIEYYKTHPDSKVISVRLVDRLSEYLRESEQAYLEWSKKQKND